MKELRRESLTWDRILAEVEREAGRPSPPLLLALDEVQWLAKRHSGVLGAIKELWERAHRRTSLTLMLAGSSNRFFATEVDHPEGVLRGLRTTGDLWVSPFGLAEVETFYFPKWTREQVALVYMMFGGVPYYLERIDGATSFVRAVNDAVFTDHAIFLDEIDAVLKVESSGLGALENVKRVLGALGQDGRTAARVAEVTGLGDASVHAILAKGR